MKLNKTDVVVFNCILQYYISTSCYNCIYASVIVAIDGDGMVVALTFVDGKVHLRCRFVETEHRLHEQKEKKYTNSQHAHA